MSKPAAAPGAGPRLLPPASGPLRPHLGSALRCRGDLDHRWNARDESNQESGLSCHCTVGSEDEFDAAAEACAACVESCVERSRAELNTPGSSRRCGQTPTSRLRRTISSRRRPILYSSRHRSRHLVIRPTHVSSEDRELHRQSPVRVWCRDITCMKRSDIGC